ncbi:MAG TPA: HNH endonuclease signature motif containing protein [Ktedonobacteraceae bacterium]
MISEDRQALFRIAQWAETRKYIRVEKVRELAGSEETYLLIIREMDRVKGQLQRARTLEAQATLTLTDWLVILEQFDWNCAYCQSRSFEIMSHLVPLPRGGTTAENCVPACYSCIPSKHKNSTSHRVQTLLARGRTPSQTS